MTMKELLAQICILTSHKGMQIFSQYRYRILALLFMATTINYLDRSIIGVLAPTLRDKVFHWSMEDYSYITMSFQLAYAIGLLGMGALVDRIGVKKGYAFAILVWSFFGLTHAFIKPAFALGGFIFARFGLGLGEAGNFPACAKAIAEWFPQDQRALATGIVNAGTNIGAILAPLLVPLLVLETGEHWQRAFFITAGFSALWIILWLKNYARPEQHKSVSSQELSLIQRGSVQETEAKLPWKAVASCKETWAFAILKTTDAVWWFYIFWGGIFLSDSFGLSIVKLGPPLVLIYLAADIGSILGGWLSGNFLKRGWPVNKARKVTLLLCAIFIVPVSFATQTHNAWIAVALMTLGTAGHQAWSVNIFTVVSDIFPKKAVASVIGIGGMVGSLTSMLAFLTLGKILKNGDASGYFIPFLIAGSLYLVVLGIAHLLIPTMKPYTA